ncbi:lipocalin family protein [Alishewanella jeotgali]|uniref:Outer membrane lipoprotein Blc n=1 Tax=Alishewanella jeotgali KCTC 22429 TaxID=1129374 RepID=H3ZG60_9ALTE|nr:lipocalin family protein [Alishewanella jeotgali]EHR40380.1 outer membrane lipoprotein, lipocalin [Alishewanella jeotgali KCTC 22429]
MRFYWLLLLLLAGCTSVPEKVTPVSPFELERYLGTWHEIARLDHRFERGLTQVTAEYSLRQDGGVTVLNRGFDAANQRWKSATGKAYFVADSNTGRLKVSFFGPFYGGYNIAKLDPDYQIALVVGPNLDYAWLLARKLQLSAAECAPYLAEAERIGIALDQLIWLAPCR